MRRFVSYVFFFLIVIAAKAQNSLDYYRQMALKNSPVFLDNQNQVNSVALDNLLIRAGHKPHVDFTSTDFYAPVVNGYGYDEIVTNKGNYNAFVGVNYAVIGKNNLNNQFSALDVQKQILNLGAKLNERDLKQVVTSQFISVYGGQRILFEQEKILNLLKAENLILKDITSRGIFNQTDYLTFLVNYKQQELNFNQLRLQTQNDLYVLNYICGIVDTNYVELSDPAISITQVISNDKPLQLQQFFLDSMRIEYSMEQIKFNYKPKLNLYGDAGYNTTFIYHAERNFGASVGLQLRVPIYDGNQRSLLMQKLKLTGNTQKGYSDFFRKQYTMKQIQLLHDISQTENLIEDARQQFIISESLLNANNKLIGTGNLRITDYVLSISNYISSQSNIQQLVTNKLQLINEFNSLNY